MARAKKSSRALHREIKRIFWFHGLQFFPHPANFAELNQGLFNQTVKGGDS
jgi:hypothetical protein